MDYFWLVLGLLFVVVGIVGSVLPLLPGPPLSFIGLLFQQLRTDPPFSTSLIIVFALLTGIVFLLDYLIPIYGTKKLGGTKYGIWGSTCGLLVGLFLGPWGIILGSFLGALVGELIANTNSNQAFRSAFGSFVGFLFGTLLKLILSFVMGWYILASIADLY